MSRTRLQTARHRYYLEAGGRGSYLIKIKKKERKKKRKNPKNRKIKIKRARKPKKGGEKSPRRGEKVGNARGGCDHQKKDRAH